MELEDYDWMLRYSGVVTMLLGFPLGSMAVHAGQTYPRWLMIYLVLVCLSLYKFGVGLATLATRGRDDIWWAPLLGGGLSMAIFFGVVVTVSGGGQFAHVMTKWTFWYLAMGVGAAQTALNVLIWRLQSDDE